MTTELKQLGVKLSLAELEYRDAQALGYHLTPIQDKINKIIREILDARRIPKP